MLIWQARLLGPVVAVAAGFLSVSLGMAQQGGQTGGSTSAPGKGTTTPTPTPTPRPTTQTPSPNQTPQLPRPIWISGTVMMYDGGPPPESVTIERVCSSNSVRPEGYTDSRGHFSFNLGQNTGIFSDASTSSFPDITQQGGLNSMTGNSGGGGTSSSNQDSAYWDCELRARLPGYRSDTVSLAGRRMLDSPHVGVIMLYPIAKIQGLTASVT